MSRSSTNLRPPFFGPGLPLYPQIDQIVRVQEPIVPGSSTGGGGGGSGTPSGGIGSLTMGRRLGAGAGPTYYNAVTQQWNGTTAFRDRENCIAIEMNGNQISPDLYPARLIGNYQGSPLYALLASSQAFSGAWGNLERTTGIGTGASPWSMILDTSSTYDTDSYGNLTGGFTVPFNGYFSFGVYFLMGCDGSGGGSMLGQIQINGVQFAADYRYSVIGGVAANPLPLGGFDYILNKNDVVAFLLQQSGNTICSVDTASFAWIRCNGKL